MPTYEPQFHGTPRFRIVSRRGQDFAGSSAIRFRSAHFGVTARLKSNVQHNIGTMLHDFENRLLAVLARREDRVDELDARLTRVEKHLGLP